MNSKAVQHKSGGAGDIVKYALAILLAAGGVFAYIWFENWNGPLRTGAVVVGLLAGAAVFMLSAKGAQTREFLSESRFELRKVVWPTRKETMQTTAAVFAFVVVMAVFLWVSDKTLEWVLYDLILGWKKT